MGKTLMLSEERQRWRTVLRALLEKKKSFYFRKPVDPVALKIPHYTTIIKRPMDLGTVEARLDSGEYLTWDAFSGDVVLVFDNAMAFNHDPAHQVHQAAKALKGFFELKHAELCGGAKVPKHATPVDLEAVERKKATLRHVTPREGGGRPTPTPRRLEPQQPKALLVKAPSRSRVPVVEPGETPVAAAHHHHLQGETSALTDTSGDDSSHQEEDESSGDDESSSDPEEPAAAMLEHSVDGMVPVKYVRRLSRRMERMKRKMDHLQRSLGDVNRVEEEGGPMPQAAIKSPQVANHLPKRLRLRHQAREDNKADRQEEEDEDEDPLSSSSEVDAATLSPAHDVSVDGEDNITPEELATFATCIVDHEDMDESTEDEDHSRHHHQPTAPVDDDDDEPLMTRDRAVSAATPDLQPRRPKFTLSPAFDLSDIGASNSPLWVMHDEDDSAGAPAAPPEEGPRLTDSFA